MEINDLTYLIRGAAFRIHTGLGPGLYESVYQKALQIELESLGIKVKTEVPIDVQWNNENLGLGFKIDLLIEDKIILELKSVNEITKVHHKQLTTYLSLAEKEYGLLINFNEAHLKNGIYRQINSAASVDSA